MGSLDTQSGEILQNEGTKFETVEEFGQEKQALLAEKSSELDFERDEATEKKLRNLWVLDGQCYDLTEFVQRHPGGSAAISLGKGMDCSELFRTYHLMKSPPDAILKKYRVPNPNGVKFPPSKFTFAEDGFIMTIRRRGREYFSSNKLSTKGPIWHQILAILAIFVIGGLLYPAFYLGSIWAAFAHGLVKGLTAVNAGHSMSHFSLFSIGWMNTFVFRVFSPLVLSTHQIWSTSHIISHHINTLTGIDLQDNYPVKRVQPGLPHLWFHRIQVFYIPLVYLFGVPLWTLSDFFSSLPVLFTGKHEMRYLTIGQRLENTIALGLNILITLAFPFFFLPVGLAFAVFCASNVPSSLMLVLQIAVNHEVPECMEKSNPMKERVDWGAHQALTSHNFGVESAFALHTSGGLNMQIEHHLFPSVHYTHYRALSKIVKQACMEFNLPYNTSKHLPEAVYKHFRLLAHCSKP